MSNKQNTPKDPTLKESIKEVFGVDLPLSGGNGNSIDNAIIIDTEDPEEFLRIQQEVLIYIHRLSNISWKLWRQFTVEKDGKTFDKQQVEYWGDNEHYFNYYFDITKYPHIKDRDYRKFPHLLDELNPRDVVFRADMNEKDYKEKPPFTSPDCPLNSKHMTVWNKLFKGEITEEEGLEEITVLMEEYYGMKYPLYRGFNH